MTIANFGRFDWLILLTATNFNTGANGSDLTPINCYLSVLSTCRAQL